VRFVVGTSGYDYPEWVGEDRFYPASLARDRKSFLTYYASQFPLVELNFTYYGHTNPRQIEGMLKRVRPEAELHVLEGAFAPREDFSFAVKAYRELTHEVSREYAEVARKFLADIEPLNDAGKLAAVVFQFPPSFRPGAETAKYLGSLADAFADYPKAFEFRNSAWFSEPVAETLGRYRVPLCWVDAPLSSHLPRHFFPLTGDFAYARFHGRSEEHWWAKADTPGEEAKQARYHYRYASKELEELARAIGETGAPKAFLLFNNHVETHAVRNARDLQEILDRLFGE